MTENRAIAIAALLGGMVLLLLILAIQPVTRFEEEYPMAAASGPAASDGIMAGQADNGRVGTGATVPSATDSPEPVPTEAPVRSATGIPCVNPDGNTLETRVETPEGFIRTKEETNGLGTFLRDFKLKKDGSPVLLYNKQEKENQFAHVAVFKLPLEKEDLQQCADSVMRVYAEFFRAKGEYSRISFSLTDDFKASYAKWREGYRIYESGNSYEWEDVAEFDGSDATFKKFMRIVFAYAGTYSIETDSKKVEKPEDMQIGDVFLQSGSPGHVVMVVDMCEDANGRKAFLLAQGYMPAQQFHLLKNPAHENDPWYYVDENNYPFETPEYTFDKPCLRRMTY